jgi:hypothetical protein
MPLFELRCVVAVWVWAATLRGRVNRRTEGQQRQRHEWTPEYNNRADENQPAAAWQLAGRTWILFDRTAWRSTPHASVLGLRLLLLSGVLHIALTLCPSTYVRGKRVPRPATTLYYGLNSAYGIGQILFALLALFAIRNGVSAMGQWSGVSLGLLAACAWFALSVLFLEYPQPRMTVALFAALLLAAAFTA